MSKVDENDLRYFKEACDKTYQGIALKFTDKIASVWVEDSTYADFSYRCDIACDGVTGNMCASVAFAMEQAMSGAYSPLCETRTNVVSIWSTQNVSITIPSIIIHK